LKFLRSGTLPFLALVLFLSPGVVIRAEDNSAENKASSSSNSDPYLSPTSGVGSWIWADKTFDGQVCLLWRAFEIPAGAQISKARLVITADNAFTLYLDGRELGNGAEWRELFVFDLSRLLTPGKHLLGVKAVNSFGFAGMLAGLQIQLAKGKTIEIKSDQTWRIVPNGVKGWEKRTEAQANWPAATVMGPLGTDPWKWTNPENVNVMPTLLPIRIYFWQTGWFQITLVTICALVILISFWLMAQLALQNKERMLLQRERARIAMDIHDDLGSRMTQLVLHGEVAQSDLPDESSMRPQLDRMCQEARDVLSTLDEILWAVNPRRDTLGDFSAYVCGYAQEFLKPTSIQCLFDVESEASDIVLDLPIRRALLMVIKETLNNAVKYSGASEVLLQIKCRGRRLAVVVQDNGKGFDPAAITAHRNGLSNMTRRMSELGGGCLVTSRLQGGCRVEFAIALKPSRRRWFGWAGKPDQGAALTDETKGERQTNEILEANHHPRQ
jgi:signal transduction histidine kinase